MTTMRTFVPALLIAFIAIGCSTTRQSTAKVTAPTPATLPYAAGSDELVEYVVGYDQGYDDSLSGRSSINASTSIETSDSRLHGYADGAIRGLKDSDKPEKPKEFRAHIISTSLPKVYENYGNWVESLPKIRIR